MIAALYIDPRGPYPKIAGVDCWGPDRDANKYDGTGPIVAHPPCGPWSTMRHMYKGDERDCAPIAVGFVRGFGGVLEHPANSRLWDVCGLPKPTDVLDGHGKLDSLGGFTVQVDQCDWGHVARKRTWLYIVGADWLDVTRMYAARPFPGARPTHWASGSRGRSAGKQGGAVPDGIKVCSAAQRRRTPPLFAAWLIELAGKCKKGNP